MSIPAERAMTKRDWEALYLVMRLQEQIVLHGAEALNVFVDGCTEARHPHRVRAGGVRRHSDENSHD